jgi:hypothetical protein
MSAPDSGDGRLNNLISSAIGTIGVLNNQISAVIAEQGALVAHARDGYARADLDDRELYDDLIAPK